MFGQSFELLSRSEVGSRARRYDDGAPGMLRRERIAKQVDGISIRTVSTLCRYNGLPYWPLLVDNGQHGRILGMASFRSQPDR